MTQKRIVVSLGHDSLGYTILQQWNAVKITAKALADLVEAGHQVVITHSNGPQVNMIHHAMTQLRRTSEQASAGGSSDGTDDGTGNATGTNSNSGTTAQDNTVGPAPMCVCSAMSQGYVGYDIQNSLRAQLLQRGLSKTVSTILTQVTVDPYDDAFYAPCKAIGGYLSEAEADHEKRKGNYVKDFPGYGYRRVVAAPKPIDIVEIEAIRALLDAGQVVIACGGGGIPVIEQQGALIGASAVIEKDAIAGKLATMLEADELIIWTGVDQVYLDFHGENPKPIAHMTTVQAKEWLSQGEFEEGTMAPKIEAAMEYLSKVPDGKVIISSLETWQENRTRKIGTVISAN
ncbi:MAG: carbamate kinase [Clostridium sp.]|jgi:carbamate kinase|nr:carbamate kinase [Clostridium sp.]